MSIFGDDIVGQWVGQRRTEEAQDKAPKKEGSGIGHDLFIDCAERDIMPVKRRALGSAEQQGTDPVGGAEDRNQGPGIVEKGAYHECEKVEAECPGQEQHQNLQVEPDGVRALRPNTVKQKEMEFLTRPDMKEMTTSYW